MKKSALLLVFGLFILASCNKQTEIIVTYSASNAISEYTLHYLDRNGTLKTVKVHPESAKDCWQMKMMKNEGDIVYLTGNYKDINSALKLQVLIDGKAYKQAESIGDTVRYLIVSGTIPYAR